MKCRLAFNYLAARTPGATSISAKFYQTRHAEPVAWFFLAMARDKLYLLVASSILGETSVLGFWPMMHG